MAPLAPVVDPFGTELVAAANDLAAALADQAAEGTDAGAAVASERSIAGATSMRFDAAAPYSSCSAGSSEVAEAGSDP